MRKLTLFTIMAILLTFITGVIFAASPQEEPPGLERAITAQEKHNPQLLGTPGVVGTAVGLTAEGKPGVKVYTERAGVSGIPETLDGIPVEVQITGKITALKPGQGLNQGKGPKEREPSTTSFWERPVPIGVSTGNIGECSAGTVGARVKDTAGNVYALSNNHVYALENTAPIGSDVVQPGRYDTNCSLDPKYSLGTLYDFKPIAFNMVGINYIDAAIALTDTGSLRNSTPASGYGTPKSETTGAVPGLKVQKFGRTTELTKGEITAVKGIFMVGYSSGIALFADQIVVESRKPFIKPGDSGSLLVTQPNNNPVGLLFAGDQTGKLAIANDIDNVLSDLHVTIDGE